MSARILARLARLERALPQAVRVWTTPEVDAEIARLLAVLDGPASPEQDDLEAAVEALVDA